MKTLLAAFLSFSIVYQSLAPTFPVPTTPVPHGLVEGAVVLFGLAGAGCIILYVFWKYDPQANNRTKTLVLQRDNYDGRWISVVTNTVTLNGKQDWTFYFADAIDRLPGGCQYRIRDITTLYP